MTRMLASTTIFASKNDICSISVRHCNFRNMYVYFLMTSTKTSQLAE